MTFVSHMPLAMAEARAAGARGEVPVGAVIVGPDGNCIARAGNRMRERGDPTAHAEMLALRAAFTLHGPRLTECDLWVTLEPCPLCAAAIGLARIRRLYYGASDPKSGGVEQGPRLFAHDQLHHRPEIYGGIDESASRALLRDFFAARRG